MILTINTDGAARGNPGEAGIGVVIKWNGAARRYKKYLGVATNNRAEYEALVFALIKTRAIIARERLEIEKIICYSDSELMVRQMRREYKVRNYELARLFAHVLNAALAIPKIEYIAIPRSQNKDADRLANEAVDGHNEKIYLKTSR